MNKVLREYYKEHHSLHKQFRKLKKCAHGTTVEFKGFSPKHELGKIVYVHKKGFRKGRNPVAVVSVFSFNSLRWFTVSGNLRVYKRSPKVVYNKLDILPFLDDEPKLYDTKEEAEAASRADRGIWSYSWK